MRMTIFKLQKPRGFQFKPRYYDADKEALRARIAEIERRVELEETGSSARTGSFEHRLRSELHSARAVKMRRSKNRTSNWRIAAFAGILFAVFYLYFYSDLETLF